jgi:DNA replication licensing factor MCM7
VGAYVNMRAEEAGALVKGADASAQSFTTARTLLSILRLGQALARLRWSDEVVSGDVDEAIRLMMMSKVSIHEEQEEHHRPFDATVGIFQIFKDAANASGRVPAVVKVADVTQRILAKGYRDNDIQACLTEYEELNVWRVSESREEVRFEQ